MNLSNTTFIKRSLIVLPLIALLSMGMQACKPDPDKDIAPPDIVPVGEGGEEQSIPTGIFYALGEFNMLYELNMKRPDSTYWNIRIETNEPGERIIAIDFRPTTGELYALSDRNALYSVNLNYNRLGVPNRVNGKTKLEADLSGDAAGLDFNPITDQIRVVTDKGDNNVVHAATGELDKEFGSPIGIATPNVGAIAYSNNYAGATSTALYGIDVADKKLIRYEGTSANQVKTVGELGAEVKKVSGFDIATKPGAGEYGIASVNVGGVWELDQVDLKTGKLKKLGNLPEGDILGIAVPTPVAYATTRDNKLLIFNPEDDDPKRKIIEKPITGLPDGTRILAMDFSLYGINLYVLASNSKIYRIDPATWKAIEKCTLQTPLDLAGDPKFGFDFAPYPVYNATIVTSNKKHFVVDISDGSVTEKEPLKFEVVSQPLDAVAFSSSQQGHTSEKKFEIYSLNSETRTLFSWVRRPNGTYLRKAGDLGIKISSSNGFDIGGYLDRGYGLFTVDGKTRLYEINLTSGTITKTYNPIFPYDVTGFALGHYMMNDIR